jgi:hypothetical protein
VTKGYFRDGLCTFDKDIRKITRALGLGKIRRNLKHLSITMNLGESTEQSSGRGSEISSQVLFVRRISSTNLIQIKGGWEGKWLRKIGIDILEIEFRLVSTRKDSFSQ